MMRKAKTTCLSIVLILLTIFCYRIDQVISSSIPSSNFVLRVQLPDGSMERILIEKESEEKEDTTNTEKMTLLQALSSLSYIRDHNKNNNDNKKTKESMPSSFNLQIGNHPKSFAWEEANMKTLADLGIKHGSLIRIRKDKKDEEKQQQSNVGSIQSQKQQQQKHKSSSTSSSSQLDYDPFPELSKRGQYQKALRKQQIRRASTSTSGSSGGLSYTDMAQLSWALHTVEPQSVGAMKRITMCPIAAERFQTSSCNTPSKKSKTTSIEYRSRVGLLLGTVQRERIDISSPRKLTRTKTSLSSTPKRSGKESENDELYCWAGHVQAIWEPSQQEEKGYYDKNALMHTTKKTGSTEEEQYQRVLRLSKALGIRPIGWIFGYTDERSSSSSGGSTGGTDSSQQNGAGLPVHAYDIEMGARLQSQNHYKYGQTDGRQYATLAMHVPTGSTEAFQLSDVTVQMVAEDLFILSNDGDGSSSSSKTSTGGGKEQQQQRFIKTKTPVLIDDRETKQLDTVLCLINTAMLSRNGMYSGSTSSVLKKNGRLTKKSVKALIKALQEIENDESTTTKTKSTTDKKSKSSKNEKHSNLFRQLSDFRILMALDELMSSSSKTGSSTTTTMITDDLCPFVRKWVRGQKLGTTIPQNIRQQLLQKLEQHQQQY